MKIGIFGAGCIGVYLGSHSIRSGQDVVLLGRPSLADEIANNGVTISKWSGAQFLVLPSEVCFSASLLIYSLNDCDVILVTVKSSATRDVVMVLNQGAILSGRQGRVIVSFQKIGCKHANIQTVLWESCF